MNKNDILNENSIILITGAGGFIGVEVVRRLLMNGHRNLRCFVKPSSNLERLSSIIKYYEKSRIEIIKGNLLIREDCENAVKNVSIVYHLAAGRGKSFAGCFLDSAVATRNLLHALIDNTLLIRFVNVSSFAVYSNIKIKRGGLLNETSEIERNHIKLVLDSVNWDKKEACDILQISRPTLNKKISDYSIGKEKQ